MTPSPIYIRVSDPRQVDGTSLESQLRDCQDAAKRHGLAPGKVFADEGESAKTADRPKFLELLDYLDKHRPPAVIVWKLDRLARNTLDSALFRSRLQRMGIRLVSATENLTDDPSGRFVADVLSAAAQYDNEVRAQRSKRSMQARAQAGGWVNAPPLGYLKHRLPDKTPSLRPDPDRAPLVAALFAAVADGQSQALATEDANRAGLRTRRGRLLSNQSVSAMLCNPVYAGWHRSRLCKERQKGTWPAIVRQDVWDRAQLHIRQKKWARRPADDFPLRGLLSCGKCGRLLTASWAQGRSSRHRYYHCHACGKVIIRADTAEADLDAMVSGLALTGDAVAILDGALRHAMATEYAPAKDAKARTARALQEAEGRMDRLVEIRLSGKIDMRTYEQKYHEAETALLLARQAHSEAEGDRIDLVAAWNAAQGLLRDPGAYWRGCPTPAKHRVWPLFFTGPVDVAPKSNRADSRLRGLNSLIWLPKPTTVQTTVLVAWLRDFTRLCA